MTISSEVVSLTRLSAFIKATASSFELEAYAVSTFGDDENGGH